MLRLHRDHKKSDKKMEAYPDVAPFHFSVRWTDSEGDSIKAVAWDVWP